MSAEALLPLTERQAKGKHSSPLSTPARPGSESSTFSQGGRCHLPSDLLHAGLTLALLGVHTWPPKMQIYKESQAQRHLSKVFI